MHALGHLGVGCTFASSAAASTVAPVSLRLEAQRERLGFAEVLQVATHEAPGDAAEAAVLGAAGESRPPRR